MKAIYPEGILLLRRHFQKVKRGLYQLRLQNAVSPDRALNRA